MNDAVMGVQAEITSARLVKWDGEPPAGAEPIGHPLCIEVIEFEPGQPPKVIYQRDET
jgi:hypothetical protein